MMFLSIVLMVLGLIGIIVCQKKQKTNPNAQGLAVICLVVILVGAGMLLWTNGLLPGAGDREMDIAQGKLKKAVNRIRIAESK